MPFYGAEYTQRGFNTPCCLMAKTIRNITEIQHDMLENLRPPECNKCWFLEDQNIKSDRQFKNEAFDFYKDRDINFIFDDCKKGNYSQQIVKLYTSNLCDSTCVTCGPSASTAWASLRNIPIKLESISTPILNNVNFANVSILTILGGEPFYDKNLFNILHKLLDNNNANCFVSFVTNGGVELTKQHVNILSQFKNLSICISIDGVGPVFEYLRYPLRWEVLLKNIKLFREISKHVTVSYTVSNLNILYYHDTVKWFQEAGLTANTNMVTLPEYFNVNSLPKSVKEQHTELSHFFVKHLSTHDTNFNRAIEELKVQDSLKKIDAKDFIPRFTNLIL
jgi:hypothetical protein